MAQSKGMIIIVALVVAVAVGSGGFWYYQKQKTEAARKAALTDALARANEVQSKVLQYYFKNKEFPSNNVQAGVPRPESFQMNALKSITIEKGGSINLLFNSQSGVDNGTIVLVPTMDIASGKLWQCKTASFPEISKSCPECVFTGNP
ncbi:MAG: pilin [Deltaproteobacteria bacterium]|nr:pilin [Deltaproteobacteria bacterium]MBN2687650.1 pilin [Deltaproteobacteria bacterium]